MAQNCLLLQNPGMSEDMVVVLARQLGARSFGLVVGYDGRGYHSSAEYFTWHVFPCPYTVPIVSELVSEAFTVVGYDAAAALIIVHVTHGNGACGVGEQSRG